MCLYKGGEEIKEKERNFEETCGDVDEECSCVVVHPFNNRDVGTFCLFLCSLIPEIFPSLSLFTRVILLHCTFSFTFKLHVGSRNVCNPMINMDNLLGGAHWPNPINAMWNWRSTFFYDENLYHQIGPSFIAPHLWFCQLRVTCGSISEEDLIFLFLNIKTI